MANEELSASAISEAVRNAGAAWEAGETSLTTLSREEQLRHLGAAPPPGVPSVEEMARRAAAPAGPETEARAVGAPAAFDWRNMNGGNYVTAIKNQGGCGSCVAFGVAAAIETRYRWQLQSPDLAADLSEAHLFYCYGRDEGRNCGNGWWPNRALEHVKDTGVVDEACFPYTDHDQDCSGRCADWAARVVKITGYTALTNQPAKMKEWISTKGALSACFVVFDDFFAYRSGVYRHVTGNQAGGHCVSIVGYDDAAGCWICKNSWGTGWGDAGFFRIAYGECSIEAWEVHGIDAIIVSSQGVRIHNFARGGDGAVWHMWQTAPNNGWSGWYSLGGWIDLLKVASNDDGRLEIFARGGDGAVWHNWELTPGGSWSGWYSLGGWIDLLDVAKNADGRLEIFARGGDGAVWHMWQTAPNNGWSEWHSLGGWIDLLDVAKNADGRLEIFARGGDGAVWHMWQTAPNNGWSGWHSLGGWIDLLDVAKNADGRLEIFARGGDGAVWHMWQTAPNNGWSEWHSLGGWIDLLDVAKNADGRLEIFARGGDGAVWHMWQTAPNNGWSGWHSLGGWIDLLKVASNDDGRLEIFARGGDGAVWHMWQTAPNNGWSEWHSLSGWIDLLEAWPEAPGTP